MNNKIIAVITPFLLVLFLSCSSISKNTLDLSGNWYFSLDAKDKGIQEKWYDKKLQGRIKIPGSLQEQGFGNDISLDTKWTGLIVDSAWYNSPFYEKYRQSGNIKVPFWLNPVKHYVGIAWYQKEIEIPDSWIDKSIFINLERPHWETTLFVDGVEIGKQNSLGVPHRYELKNLSSGKHLVSIRVDNRLVVPVGINAHSVSDHTQSNWNGIIGDVSLEAKPKIYAKNATIYPDVKNKRIRIVSEVINSTGSVQEASIKFIASSISSEDKSNSKIKNEIVHLKPGINTYDLILNMGDDVLLWDEFSPNLYQLKTIVVCDNIISERSDNFGMREIGKSGRRFTINGNPIFLRGTLECAIFPLTGYPPTDEDSWEKICRKVKEYGLNHIRFHSWCPPKAAFNVADREGVYLQVECGGWTLVGAGNSFDQWVYNEGDRILSEYGNHPSFFALLYGNEPDGNSAEFLGKLVDYWSEKDGRHMYSTAGGWPYSESADFFNSPDPRIQAWGGGLKSLINAKAPETAYDFREIIQKTTMPTISHEIGQWCAYPDFKEIPKYRGVLKAKNFEIFKETLADNHMEDLAEMFLKASGKLQTLCYKADIEAALRTPEFAGFQLLDLHDFPGQGTALVGVLNVFWESKGYVTPEEYRMFCNRTVPLARMNKLIWGSDEIFEASIEVSYFDKLPLNDAKIKWSIADLMGNIYNEGSLKSKLPITNCIEVGEIKFPLTEIKEAKKLILTVEIPEAKAKNQWNIWVYPQVSINTGDVYITDRLDDKAKDLLQQGGKVLLALKRNSLKPDKGGDIKVGFSSIFWNTAWTKGEQPPHELGILCDPSHPLFKYFPTAYHSDFNWWEIVSNADAMVMDGFSPELMPLVHFIDDWFTNRKLGMLFEAKVNNGKLMVTSADLYSEIDERISAKQFKYSLLEYMKSDSFNPKFSLLVKDVEGLLK